MAGYVSISASLSLNEKRKMEPTKDRVTCHPPNYYLAKALEKQDQHSVLIMD